MGSNGDSAKNWTNPNFVANKGAAAVAESLLLGRGLRAKVAGGFALGSFVIEIPDPEVVTVMSLAGFDFVVLDMEHSPIDFGRLGALLSAGRAAGIPMLVRPWGEDSGLIGKVLDMGAHGIMVPHVGSAERAREVVRQARFAPTGNRGFSPLTRFASLQMPLRDLDDATFVVVQIEGRDALDRVGEIAAVAGIDAVFVGPYDLALSLDVPPGSKEVNDAIDGIARAAKGGQALGIYVDEPAKSAGWAAKGFALQCVSFDSRMLSIGAKSVVDQARGSHD